MENVQLAINEYKDAASCMLYLRRVVSQAYHTVTPHWDMEENALTGVGLLHLLL